MKLNIEDFTKHIKRIETKRLSVDVDEETSDKITQLKQLFNIKTDSELIRTSIQYIYEIYFGNNEQELSNEQSN